MSEQTKAQRLSDKLHHELPTILRIDAENAGIELRRLDANEAALLEALKTCRTGGYRDIDGDFVKTYRFDESLVRALITRIESERKHHDQKDH